MPEVVVVRPGCTSFDEEQRIQGSLDLPLSSRGEEQVDALCDQLAETGISAIYTSPSDPAASTASLIGGRLGVPVTEKKELRNLDQGLWQGLPISDVKRKYPKAFKQWCESPGSVCPPEGEAVPEALDRIRKGLGKPLKKKDVFAVVASEPLATLIESFLSGNRPALSHAFGNGDQTPKIEVVDTDQPKPSSNGNGRANGSASRADTDVQGDK